MAVYEDEFVYTMIAFDALIVMPISVRSLIDTNLWSEADRSRAIAGSHQPRNPRVNSNLCVPFEEALLGPMRPGRGSVSDHFFCVQEHKGNLINHLTSDMATCKASLGAFMANGGAFEPAITSMGQMAHRIIDICNPFNLVQDPGLEPIARRFMESVRMNILQMPFMASSFDSPPTMSPYTDKMTTKIEAERRLASLLTPIVDGFVRGNGFPAVRAKIEEWYNATTNSLARAWQFCAI